MGGEGFRLLSRREKLESRYGVAFHPTRPELLASATRSGLELWDVNAGKLLQTLASGDTLGFAFFPDESSLLTSGGQGVRRWKLPEPAAEGLLVAAETSALLLPGASERISIDGAGRRVAVDRGFDTAAILTLDPPQRPRTIRPQQYLDHVALSSDGRWLVTTTWKGAGVVLWDIDKGLGRNLAPDVGSATPAFSPDGHWLAVSDGIHVYMWEVATWRQIQRVPREHPDGWPGPVAFSPDGRLLAVPYTRNIAQLIDPQSGNTLGMLEPPHSTSLSDYSFSCDGRYFAAAQTDHIQLWDLAAIRSRLAEMKIDWAVSGRQPSN